MNTLSERLKIVLEGDHHKFEVSDPEAAGTCAIFEVHMVVPYGIEKSIIKLQDDINEVIQDQLGNTCGTYLTKWAINKQMLDEILRDERIHDLMSEAALCGDTDEIEKMSDMLEEAGVRL